MRLQIAISFSNQTHFIAKYTFIELSKRKEKNLFENVKMHLCCCCFCFQIAHHAKTNAITHHRWQTFPLNSMSHISMQLRTVHFQCLDVDHALIEKCHRYPQEKRAHFLHSLTSRQQTICKVSPSCWRYVEFDSIRLKTTI